jgi:hypothetical protein
MSVAMPDLVLNTEVTLYSGAVDTVFDTIVVSNPEGTRNKHAAPGMTGANGAVTFTYKLSAAPIQQPLEGVISFNYEGLVLDVPLKIKKP